MFFCVVMKRIVVPRPAFRHANQFKRCTYCFLEQSNSPMLIVRRIKTLLVSAPVYPALPAVPLESSCVNCVVSRHLTRLTALLTGVIVAAVLMFAADCYPLCLAVNAISSVLPVSLSVVGNVLLSASSALIVVTTLRCRRDLASGGSGGGSSAHDTAHDALLKSGATRDAVTSSAAANAADAGALVEAIPLFTSRTPLASDTVTIDASPAPFTAPLTSARTAAFGVCANAAATVKCRAMLSPARLALAAAVAFGSALVVHTTLVSLFVSRRLGALGLRPACSLGPRLPRRADVAFTLVTGPVFERDVKRVDAARASSFQHILNVTLPNKAAYAAAHGYSLYAPVIPDAQAPALPWFAKIDLLQQALARGADWVMWTDLDTLIMEPERTLESVVFSARAPHAHIDLVITHEGCTGMFLLRNTPWAHEYLRRWARVPRQAGIGDGLDQGASAYVLSNASFVGEPARVWYVPVCALNSKPHLWGWHERFMHGDFVVHCAGDLHRVPRLRQLDEVQRGERAQLDWWLDFL